MTKYRLEVKKSWSGKWFWRIRHKNGNILCTSELYSKKAKAWQTVNNFLGELRGVKNPIVLRREISPKER